MDGARVRLFSSAFFANQIHTGLAKVSDGRIGVECALIGHLQRYTIMIIWNRLGLFYMIENQENSLAGLRTLNKNARLIDKFVQYSHQKADLLSKFNVKYIAQILPLSLLQTWSKLFTPPHSQIDLEEFIALFCSGINHSKEQTLYLMLSLMKMYRLIKNKSKYDCGSNSIEFSEISDYLCEKIVNEENSKLEMIYRQKNQQAGSKKSPYIKHLYAETLPFICKEQVNKQKSLKNEVKHLQYCEKIDKILSLTQFSTKIDMYNCDLKLRGGIAPALSQKYKNQPIITSYAYSSLERRVGCVVQGIDLVFMELSDKFEAQKLIEGVKADKIFYFNFFSVWATLRANCISIWNIVVQKQHYRIQVSEAKQICCVEQIEKIQSIIISVCYKNNRRQLQIHKLETNKSRLVSRVEIQYSGCHSLHLNSGTESILQLGFSNVVNVWQYDSLTHEMIVVGKLVGHRSILMCAESIGGSTVVVTGDDKGFIKLWDLKQFRCFQTMRIGTKQIKQLLSIKDFLLIGENRLSIVHLDDKKQYKPQRSCISLIASNEKIYMFSTDSCNVVCLKSGQVIEIFRICEEEEEILAAQMLRNSFCIGTNKGHIIIVDKQFQNRKLVRAHENSIGLLKVNNSQSWLVSIGFDQKMHLWVFDPAGENIYLCKTLKNISFADADFLQVEICDHSGVIGLAIEEEEICIIDVQNFKLCERLNFSQKISCFKFHPFYSLLMVSLRNSTIYLIQFIKNKLNFKVKAVNNVSPFKIFPITCFQPPASSNQYAKLMLINKIGQLVCVSNNRAIYVYDLNLLITELNIKPPTFKQKTQGNIFRPVVQNFQHFHQTGCLQMRKYESSEPNEMTLKLSKTDINCKSVSQIVQNSEQGTYMLLCSRGLLVILESKSLQKLGEKRSDELRPSHWTEPLANLQDLRTRIIQSIKINQKIHRTNFRPELQAAISLDKLNLQPFLSSLALKPSNIIQQPTKQVIKRQDLPLKHHSVFLTTTISLKNMEREKRLKKFGPIEEHPPSFKALAMGRKLNGAYENNQQSPLRDTFFLQMAKQRHSLNKNQKEESCKIYEEINESYNKWKLKKKSRSLSTLSTSFLDVKRSTAKKLSKPEAKQKIPSQKWDIRQKIGKLFGKKDKRFDLVRKIFKRQLKEFNQASKHAKQISLSQI